MILSSVIGAMVSSAKAGHHRLLVSFAAGLAYYMILLACNAMLFDGKYQGAGVTALAVLGGSGAAVLFGLRNKNPKPRNAKYHNIKLVQNRQTGNR